MDWARSVVARLLAVAVVVVFGIDCVPAAADTVTPVAGTTILWGVGCATATNCVTVGDAGQVGQVPVGAVVPTNGINQGMVQQVTGTNELYSVACPSATECLAVGTGNFASQGVVVRIGNSVAGGSRFVPQTATLRGIACSSSTSCLAVGWQTGNYNGSAARIGAVVPLADGVPQAVELISGTLDLHSVACSSSGSCVAVGTAAPNGADGAVVPISNGTAGGAETVSGTSTLEAVACGSDTSCAAVSADRLVPIASGSPEAAIQVPGASSLWGIACPSTTTCWAVGTAASGPTGGFALLDASANYSGQFVVERGTSRLYGVACTDQGSCVAAGQAPPLGAGPGVIAAFGTIEGPWKQRDKAAAKLDLPNALRNATTFCTPHALALAGFGTGVLLISSTIGGTLAVAGAITAYATAPFCTATITRVATDYRRFKDPPDPSSERLATPAPTNKVRLPSCNRWRGSPRAFCAELSAPERKWAQDAELVAAITRALETTQARESAALAAGNQAAANLQDGHIPVLEQQERTALAAEASASHAIAHILKAHRIGWRMSKQQSRSTIAAVELALAKQGTPTSALTKLAAPKLKPRPINILAVLLKG